MPVLQPNEYDQSYFDGQISTYAHNAGYRKYRRWFREDPSTFPNLPESKGEYFKDIAATVDQLGVLTGKKCLDIGCAYGFIVEDLRDLGYEVYGLDCSQYAHDKARQDIQQYITVADARTYLQNYSKNEFDVIWSRRFMECMADEDIPDLIDEMNRISKYQVHIIGCDDSFHGTKRDYYNLKTINDWLSYDWDKGTILIPWGQMKERYTK